MQQYSTLNLSRANKWASRILLPYQQLLIGMVPDTTGGWIKSSQDMDICKSRIAVFQEVMNTDSLSYAWAIVES